MSQDSRLKRRRYLPVPLGFVRCLSEVRRTIRIMTVNELIYREKPDLSSRFRVLA